MNFDFHEYDPNYYQYSRRPTPNLFMNYYYNYPGNSNGNSYFQYPPYSFVRSNLFSNNYFPHPQTLESFLDDDDDDALRSSNMSKPQHLQSRSLEVPCHSESGGERTTMNMSGHYQKSTVKYLTLATRANTRSIPLDVITEILKRLPAKYILRFRCVCKSWNCLTREHHFTSQHLENRPDINDLGVITLHWVPSRHELSVRYFINGYHKFVMTYLFKEEMFKMSNSCDGLVCVYWRQTTYLVNPSIREVVVLPETKNKGDASVAVVKNISTGEYKIVRVFQRSHLRTGCEILNLGSHSWKVIQDAPGWIDDRSPPVVMNGLVHWGTHGQCRSHIAVSFDIKNESFDAIKKPVGFCFGGDIFLADLVGCLCVLPLSPALIYKDIWILKDCGKREWLRWRIDIRQIKDTLMATSMIPVMVRGGGILWQSRSGRFDYYDIKNKKFLKPLYDSQKYRYDRWCVCSYKESLISPIAIQKANLDGSFFSGVAGK